jgi:Domain of unknown function (DUF1816)
MKSITNFFSSKYQALQNEEVSVRISEYWANALHFWGRAWWIEVSTSQPSCLYYFGPFANSKEAERLMAGYVEDLESESAQGIRTKIKRCKPDKLTVEGGNEQHDQKLAYALKMAGN